jgi:hypothetical protein
MPSKCYGTFRFKRVRATLLDACGNPVIGSSSTVMTDGMIKVDIKAVTQSGDTYVQKNGDGKLCINESSPDQLQWLTTDIDFCKVDPELYNLLTGLPLVMDDATTPNAIGYSITESDWASGNAALEFWQDVSGQACGTTGKTYRYVVLPFNVYGVPGDQTLENGATTFTISSRTHKDSPWGVGPYNVRMTQGATPTAAPLLTAIQSDEHVRSLLTTLAPPAAACGAVALAA